MKFLTAHWHNLILANYAIPADLLKPYLPPDVELDYYNGQTWGSLVGFQFLNTRVLGISWPGYRNFPEWNLRFYVRCAGERGVVFVREFVPQLMTASLARLIYNEPYRACPLTMSIQETSERIEAHYTVTWQGTTHSLRAAGTKPAFVPAEDSAETFFKEHSWGFGTSHRGKRIRYEVQHEAWSVYPVVEFEAEVDWAKLYGPKWGQMNGQAPGSVVLAKGSSVSVYPHRRS